MEARGETITLEGPKVLGGIRTLDTGVDGQRDEGQYSQLEQNPVHYITGYSSL